MESYSRLSRNPLDSQKVENALAELADLVRMMNSYCSNLIEGYNTRLSTSSARSAMVHAKTSSRVCQTFRFIQTAFGSVKLSIAAVPCSRPKPESRTPPHGSRTSV
jgi:hypothetical protein